MMLTSGYSIRRKITELVLITCAVAVLVACGVFAVYDILSSRAALARDLTTVAQITGSNSTAALSFDDAESASEILSSLSSKPHIVKACIYKRDGRVFAKYSSSASAADFQPPPVSPNGVRSVSGFMEVFREIRLKDDVVGVIYVKSDLKELRTRTVHFAWTTLGVILLSLLSVYFSAARLIARDDYRRRTSQFRSHADTSHLFLGPAAAHALADSDADRLAHGTLRWNRDLRARTGRAGVEGRPGAA
jgi:uncharacterized membrane protein affecting hemolysin expression